MNRDNMNRSYMQRLSAHARFWMRGPRGLVIAVFVVLQLAIVFTGANGIGILFENKTGREIHSVTVSYGDGSGDIEHLAHIGHLAVNEFEFVPIYMPYGKYAHDIFLEIRPEENSTMEHRNTRGGFSWLIRGWVRITLGAGFSVESSEGTWGGSFIPFSALGYVMLEKHL